MSFELSTLALTEEATLHLEHPATGALLYAPVKKGEDAESKPVRIIVRGSASQAYAKAVDSMVKHKKKIAPNRDLTPDESRTQNVEFLVALSVTAENLTLDGEAVDNKDTFRKLYSDSRYDWIKEQLNTLLASPEHFLKS